jgi:hypothetical protein
MEPEITTENKAKQKWKHTKDKPRRPKNNGKARGQKNKHTARRGKNNA